MKYYAGLDVSNNTTNVCIVDDNGNFLLETVCATDPQELAKNLVPYADHLDVVGLEAGSLTFWLVSELRSHDLPAVCLDSRQVANMLSTVINKTDKNDARGIALILRSKLYTVVHQRSKESIEIGLLMTIRSGLVSDRTKKKNRIRGVLKSYGIRLKTTAKKASFSQQVIASIADLPETIQTTIRIALKDYEEAVKRVEELDSQLDEAIKKAPVAELLASVPGVGPITALSFIAEIDDPTRFKQNPEKVSAYLGLTPRQYSSGESVRLGGISKSGSRSLRSNLYASAVVMLTSTKSWSKLKSWGLRLKKRMPFKKAATAVARKLAVILLKMWLTGEAFRFSEPQDKTSKKQTGKLSISSEQPCPIVAKPPVGIKAKPCGLATLDLDPQPVCLAP